MNIIEKINGTVVNTRINDDVINCGVIVEDFFYRDLYNKGISIKRDLNKEIETSWLHQDFDGKILSNYLTIKYTDGSVDRTLW